MAFKTLSLIALVAAAAAVANAQQQWSETYPPLGEVPPAKPEWLALIANANITNAPILPSTADGNVDVSNVVGNDYCNWSIGQCLAPTDLYTCPTAGVMAVSFDDGPSEFSTRLYDYLDSINQDLTFFMVGGQVYTYPEVALRAFQSGHELAMHTWSHRALTTLTNEQIVAELKWNEQVIREVTGYSPKFFRPPYGNIDNRVRDIAAALGFIPVIWTDDTNDWQITTGSSAEVSAIEANIAAWGATNATEGGISLSHDIHELTVNAAVQYMPVFDRFYTLQTVGRCTGVTPYKESDSYDPANEPQPSVSAVSAPAVASPGSLHTRQVEDSSSPYRPAAITSLGMALVAGTAYFLLA